MDDCFYSVTFWVRTWQTMTYGPGGTVAYFCQTVLEHTHAHLFVDHPWLFLQLQSWIFAADCVALKPWNIYYLAFYRPNMSTLCSQGLQFIPFPYPRSPHALPGLVVTTKLVRATGSFLQCRRKDCLRYHFLLVPVVWVAGHWWPSKSSGCQQSFLSFHELCSTNTRCSQSFQRSHMSLTVPSLCPFPMLASFLCTWWTVTSSRV